MVASLQKTYYPCRIFLIVAILFLFTYGCAGRQGGGGMPSGSTASVSSIRVRPQPGLKPPVIRVGLKTDAKTVSITSDNIVFFSDGSREGGALSRVVVGLSFFNQH